MNKMKLALIPLLLLLCSVVVTTTAYLAPVVREEIEWRLEFAEQTNLDIRFISENMAWQRFDQTGDVYDGDDDIGDITMQGHVMIDTITLKGHANVKFVITLDEGDLTIKGVMNGKIWYEDELGVDQLIDGRFNGNGDCHIHGTVTNLPEPQLDTALLTGWKR